MIFSIIKIFHSNIMDGLAKTILIDFKRTSQSTKIDHLLSEFIAVIQSIHFKQNFTECNLLYICDMLQTVKNEGKRKFPYNTTLVTFGKEYQAENYIKDDRMYYKVKGCLDTMYYEDTIRDLVPKDISQEDITFLQTTKPIEWFASKPHFHALLYIIQQYLQNITR